MPEQAKIMTLHDHDTGEPIAPRTDIKALSGEGKKWNYVGFTEDNVVGLIEGTWPCNRNLLDNWYFVGGGSQQGGGQFPINQRGQTEYTESGSYSIDRFINVINCKLALEQDGLLLTCISATDAIVFQKLEKEILDFTLGKKCTLSVMYVDPNREDSKTVLTSVTFECRNGESDWLFLDATESWFCGMVESNGEFMFRIFTGTLDASIKLKAIKLELGSTQTLAHQENGVWVLNEIPDYSTELAKCQRYQIVFPLFTPYIGGVTIDAGDNPTGGGVLVTIPEPLYKIPTLINPIIRCVLISPSGAVSPAGVTITSIYYAPGQTYMRLLFDTTGFTTGSIGYADRQQYVMSGPQINGAFILDANI